ncbi:MAG: hypothetical protein J1E05_08200 [Eubacterium sp.]|nr:hypothetical protein [Eubacterium sp.]
MNNAICVALVIRAFSLKFLERDIPIFTSALMDFFAWLSEHDPIGELLATPLAFICFCFFILTYFSLLLEPRKVKPWKEIVFVVDVIYLVIDIPMLIAVRIMNLPAIEQSFFWSQIIFDFLMLFLLILKIKIMNNEKRKT